MKLIDLSHKFVMPMPVYPGDPAPLLSRSAFLDKDGFNDTRLITNMHVGTHVDAPLHMLDGGKKISDFPVEKFYGRGIVVDVRGKLLIEASDLRVIETSEASVVLLFSGWSEKYGKEEYFLNAPSLSLGAAEYLAQKKVNMVGLDFSSPDSPPFEIHKKLLSNEILILENLANLDMLVGSQDFEIFAFPLNLPADAAQARVVTRL